MIPRQAKAPREIQPSITTRGEHSGARVTRPITAEEALAALRAKLLGQPGVLEYIELTRNGGGVHSGPNDH